MTLGPGVARRMLGSLGAVAIFLAPTQSQADETAKAKVFADTDKLVGYLASDRPLKRLCTPEPIASYDLFQSAVEGRISTLLYLQDYKDKLGLSQRTVLRANECIAILEKYVDSQERWEALRK